MAAQDKELQYILSLRDEASKVFNAFTSNVEKNSASITGMAKTAGLAIGAMFSVGKAMEYMQAAADAEAITSQLANAVHNAADARTGDTEALIAQSEALKKKTATDEEEIQKVQTLLVGMTGSVNASEQLTMAVLDLAKGLGISTDAAAKMFGKSVEGQNALGRLGITIKETSDDSKRMAEIAAEVEKKWGGAAEAFARTDAGKIESAKIAVDDLEKSVGKLLNDTFLPAMPGVLKLLEGADWLLTKFVQGLHVSVTLLMTEIITPLAMVESVLNNLGVTQSHVLQNFSDSGMNQIKKYFTEFINGTEKAKESTDGLGKSTVTTTATAKNLYDQIDALQKKLKDLDPGSKEWNKTEIQIVTLQNQLDVFTEHAKLAAKGLQGITSGDIAFVLNVTPRISPIDTAKFSTDLKLSMEKSIGDSFFVTPQLNTGKFTNSLQQLKDDSVAWIKQFNEETKKMFGGDISPEEIAKVISQMDLINELKLKSVGDGKQAELDLVNEWEQKAIAQAQENETLITQVHQTAEQERQNITRDYNQQTFEQVAQFATKAASLYSKSISQSTQALVIAIQKTENRELDSLDKQKTAIQDKYSLLLENENLTSEEKVKIHKQEAAEIAKIDAQKEAAQNAFEEQIRQAKIREFNANKQAAIISTIINTAVEVTKVLATPWMIPIVAGLGLIETALIASQPTPSFHTGGVIGKNKSVGDEVEILAQAGETIRTVAQEKSLQDQVQNITSAVNELVSKTSIHDSIFESIKEVPNHSVLSGNEYTVGGYMAEGEIAKSIPSFHTGGSGFFDAPPTEETYVKIRGKEKIDVYTPEQMASQNRVNSPSVIHLMVNFNSPVSDEEFVRNAIKKTLKQTGLEITEAYQDTSGNTVLA
jgi:hypothetical protein